MLKKFLALVSFILFTYSLLASVRGTGEMIIEWDYNLNVSSSTDIADGVAIDSDNNIIVAGYDRDPGNDQWRIMKFDQNKDLVWNKKFDFNPNYHDRAHDVAVDSENNIIVVGYYRNATSERDWMIMKLDSSGTSIWNYTRDISNGVDRAYGVAVDSDNNITVVGHDQEPGNLQWRVIKLDKDKNLLWDKPFEISTSDDEAFDVAVDSENNIIVVGYYWNATSGRDLMIMKLGPFGNHVWNYTRGISSNDDRARGVAIDSDNNITVVGYYYNSSVSADGWMIMKLNSSGNHVWNYTIDPSLSSDIAYDVAIDSENNIIVVGYYWNATNGEDWMMMKLDSSGNSVWNYTRSISTSDDRALGITNYSNDNIIVVGYDQNTTDSLAHQWRIMELDKYNTLIWDNAINVSSSTDMAYAVAIDSDNNITVAGFDRDPGNDQWRVIKFDQNKDLVWNKKFNLHPTSHDRVYDVAIDSENNIIVVGYYRNATTDWMTMKLNPSGDSIWNYTRDITGTDRAYGVATDSSDNIIVVGYDIEPGSYQWKIVKLDKNSNLIWNKTHPTSAGVSYAYDVAVDNNDHIIVVGRDNEPGDYQWRIMKLNSTGHQIWNYTKNLCPNYDSAESVAVDSNNNIIVVGYDQNVTPVNDQWRIMKFKPNVLDGFDCNSGYDCFSGLCVEGYCRSACSDTYDGQRCSNSTNKYDSDGICTRIDGGWECDKEEASLYNGDYWNDCDKTIDDQECDPDSLAGGYYQDGYCQGSTCCLSTHDCYLNSPDCDATDSCIDASTWRDYNGDNLWDISTIEDCTSSCVCFQDYTTQDNDLIQDACDNCVGSGRWNIGGDVSNCCGDDTGEYKIDSTYDDSIDGSPASTDACCNPNSDCVHSNNCYASGGSYSSVDSDADTDYCLNNIWYDCSDNTDCESGQFCDNNDNDCKPYYLIVDSIELSYWNTTHWVTPDPFDVSPIEGDNRQMNVTVIIQNSTTVTSCLIRVFNSTDSYSNPSIGPFFGSIRKVGSRTVCNRTWNMEYWRNPGDWNVSVDLNGLVIDENTVGYWKLEENTDDSSNYGNDGTINGDPQWVTGKFGKALDLDGAGDYVNCGNDSSLNFPTELTVSFWMKPNENMDSSLGRTDILTKRNAYWFIYDWQDGQLSWVLRTGATHQEYTTTFNENEWYHIVGIRESDSNTRIYINGIEKVTGTTQGGPASSIYRLFLGNSDGYAFYFNGTFDDVRIWNRALSPEEINATYNSGVVSNFTSTSFTYTELYSLYINVSTVNFTGFPGETVNSTSAYPLSMKNIGNVELDVSINGTDFIGETDPSEIIGVENISYNESEVGGFIDLTYDYSLVFSFLTPTTEKYLYFRDYIPIGFKAQFYNNTIGIKRVKS